jgi:pyruvate formate lyase activating enzyme
MTCSGGEPLLQYSFAGALMAVAKAKGVHTALDTAGNVGYAAFEHVLPYTDLVLYDIKCMDADLHRRVTGVGNELILSNLKRLTSGGKRVWIRIPVISGINDNIQNMFATAEYLSSLSGIEKLELLPYHNLGLGKYESLGMIEKRQDTIKPPNEEVLSVLADAFTGAGYEVAIN